MVVVVEERNEEDFIPIQQETKGFLFVFVHDLDLGLTYPFFFVKIILF